MTALRFIPDIGEAFIADTALLTFDQQCQQSLEAILVALILADEVRMYSLSLPYFPVAIRPFTQSFICSVIVMVFRVMDMVASSDNKAHV